jgi:hypothetical protein
MLTGANVIKSEECIFYIDLTTNFLKKKSVIKAISSFIKEKDKFNALSSYGLVIFQNDDNPISKYDIKDSEVILTALNNAWDAREVNQSFLENGLYEILAYIFRKSRDNRKNYRIIIISDAPSKLDEDYYNALYDLLLKAKKFSAFIDIIRVGEEKFYDDDVKLKVISSETYGGMFYCQDEKLLQNILGSLVQTKKEFKVLNTDNQDQVLKEDKVFYERLAVDLISLSAEDEEICSICEQELCPICEIHSDEIHKCFNCDTKFHSCCAAKYSLARNIGFKHLFRCPQCETLLKIDEDYVNMVYEEDLEGDTAETEIDKHELTEIPQQTEFIQDQLDEEQWVEQETYEEIDLDESVDLPQPPSEGTKKVRVGGYFGKEVEVKINNSLPSMEVTQTIYEESEEKVSITTLKPPKKRGTATIKLCKICGATLQNTRNCPMCGAQTD